MRLTRLEARGFKSFPDHTTVTFGHGITAIVGPNGCGKSNLADAILWALGEQSVKALRGDRMDEVIFNGTETRKPLGLAEVSLTFEDLTGDVSPPYNAYTELTVTRRLFRSGESEYLINKTPCRLRDIRELLVDTGAGLKGYSIIEQGRVESLIALSPLERRTLVEEAAGVAKYKMRRLEAERKMALTSQNLVRVTDILAEVTRQVTVLKRQAKQAEEYQRLTAEVADLERRRAGLEWSRLREEWSRVGDRARRLTEQGEQASTELARLEREELSGRDQRHAASEALARERQGWLDLEREASRAEAQAEALRAQRSEMESRAAHQAGDVAELTQELDALASRADEIVRQAAEAARLVAEQRRRVEQRVREAGDADPALPSREIEQARARSVEAAAAMTAARNRLAACEAQAVEIQATRRRVRQEQEALRRARTQADEGLKPADHLQIQGLRVVLAHALRIPPAVERAVEAILGERLAGLVMEDEAAIEAAVPLLRSGHGSQTLFPREPSRPRPSSHPSPLGGEGKVEGWGVGVLGFAVDLIESPADVRPVVEYLLGGVVIVQDLATALAARRAVAARDEAEASLTWVTVDGLMVGPGGDVSWRGETRAIENSPLAEVRLLKDRLATLETEQVRIEEDGTRCQEDAAAAARDLEALEAERRESKRAIEALQADLSRRQAAQEAARAAQTQDQVGMASLDERLRHLQADRDRVAAARTQRAHQLDKRRAAAESDQAARLHAETRLRELEAKIVTLRQARIVRQRAIEGLEAASRAEEERLRAVDEAIRRQRDAREAFQRQAHELEVSRAGLRVRMEGLEAGHPGLADPHPAPSPLEGEGWGEGDLDDRIAALQQRLTRVGAVNLAALDEFRALEERHAALVGQETDLRRSLDDLETAIKTINETIHDRFCTTFETVASAFQQAFVTFFGGGQARLILLDKAHPLESGVEIVAQPPGKRQVNLSLLSGGEKTLTAIALIFAGFSVRPSPFYLLDEVDAALDDQNVRRFAAALKPMAARAQLLIVTHSKQTMEAADHLYGVTMEDAGVSKLIGVRLSPAPAATEQVPA